MSKIRADKFVNNAADGAPELTYGAEIPVGYGLTGAGGVNITGVVTAAKFVGSGSGLSGIDATALKDSGGSVKVQGNTSGVVVTGVSTFSSNVSIGGTLIYDDVTNIDSVGVVTARAGIKIGAGQSVSAVSGIVTYYGDGSKLSGVESGVVNFVASGNIANGQTVVIKTDGTVGIITQTGSANPSVGSVVTVNSLNSAPTAAYDVSSGKVVICWSEWNGSAYSGKAIVGTVSGTSISFGSAVTFNSGQSSYQSLTYDSANSKVVIVYTDGNQYTGRAKVGTVSGNSISFGGAATFNNAQSTRLETVSTPNGKVVVVYTGSSNYGTARVGTISGTSISFGSAVVFNSRLSYKFACAYDSTNDKVVVFYQDQDNSSSGRAKVGTISGTSISFGSEAIFISNSSDWYSATGTTNGKVVVAFEHSASSNDGTAVVGTVSGTSITFGTPVVFNSSASHTGMTYDSAKDKVIIAYAAGGGKAIVGTISGTSISFGTQLEFDSSSSYYNSPVYDSANGKVVIPYRAGAADYAYAVVFTTNSIETNLTAENYIGIAAETISNGATGKITVLTGTNTGQTGLTTAQKYFVQTNGTLGTSAGSPSVIAGTAISDTKIVVR